MNPSQTVLCLLLSLSCVWLFTTSWTVAHQAPLSSHHLCCHITNYLTFRGLKQHPLVSSLFCRSGALGWPLCLGSHKTEMKILVNLVSSMKTLRGAYTLKLAQLLGRRHFLVVVGLRSPFSYLLSARAALHSRSLNRLSFPPFLRADNDIPPGVTLISSSATSWRKLCF